MARGGHCVEFDDILRGEVLDEVCVFHKGRFDRSWLKDLVPYEAPHQDPRLKPRGPGVIDNWVHVKNESAHRSVFDRLGGLDERLDRGKGPMDIDVGIRLKGGGFEMWWEPSAITFNPNPRFLCRTMPWGHMTERVDGRWSYDDGGVYNERRKKEIADGGSIRANNPYVWEEFQRRISPWRYGVGDPKPIDVGDEEYYGVIPWPDSP